MINENEEADVLGTSFFSRLSKQSREILLSASYVQHFAAGSILYRKNDPCHFAFIALDGAVAWITGEGGEKEWVIEFVPPGELVSLLAVRLNTPYVTTGRLVEGSRVVVIPAATLRDRLEADPQCALTALDTLATRVVSLSNQIRELKSRSACQRLAGFILDQISDNQLERSDGDIKLTLPWPRHLIATRLGIVPESMSRVFAELKEYGVEGRGTRLLIHSVQQLRDLVQTDALRGKTRGT
jgi:CRP/FNR family transcriptional activator FtrB